MSWSKLHSEMPLKDWVEDIRRFRAWDRYFLTTFYPCRCLIVLQLATGEHPYEQLTAQQETEMKFWTLVSRSSVLLFFNFFFQEPTIFLFLFTHFLNPHQQILQHSIFLNTYRQVLCLCVHACVRICVFVYMCVFIHMHQSIAPVMFWAQPISRSALRRPRRATSPKTSSISSSCVFIRCTTSCWSSKGSWKGMCALYFDMQVL